jgi:hypothetical protein
MTGRRCAWCGRAFLPGATGAKRQTFCRLACRRAFDAAGRRWVAEAIASGVLTVEALRSGPGATRALAGVTDLHAAADPIAAPVPAVSYAPGSVEYSREQERRKIACAPAEEAPLDELTFPDLSPRLDWDPEPLPDWEFEPLPDLELTLHGLDDDRQS